MAASCVGSQRSGVLARRNGYLIISRRFQWPPVLVASEWQVFPVVDRHLVHSRSTPLYSMVKGVLAQCNALAWMKMSLACACSRAWRNRTCVVISPHLHERRLRSPVLPAVPFGLEPACGPEHWLVSRCSWILAASGHERIQSKTEGPRRSPLVLLIRIPVRQEPWQSLSSPARVRFDCTQSRSC